MAKKTNMDYFDRNEDMRFSDYVRRYNSLETSLNEREKMEASIEDRTRKLLYMIPKRNLLLEDDDLAAFYLEMQKDIRRYIESFTIEGTSYNAYLTKICRYRVQRFRRDKLDERFTELALLRSAEVMAGDSWHEKVVKEAAIDYRSKYYQKNNYEDMDIAEVLRRVINERHPFSWTNKKEHMLGSLLKNRGNRKCFLMYLMYIPEDSEPAEVSRVAAVLGSPVDIILRFFEIKHQILAGQGTKSERIEKCMHLVDEYWLMMQKLILAMDLEWDPERKMEQKAKYDMYLERLRKKQDQLQKLKRGLTQKQIAEMFGGSRSTVSGMIEKGRELLIKVNEECNE